MDEEVTNYRNVYRGTNQGSKLANNDYLWIDGVLESDSEFGATGFNVIPSGYIQSDGILKDWLEIGVFGKNDDSEDSLLYLKKVFITDSVSRFNLKLDSKPYKAGIDPLYKFVDRDSKDNLMKVSIIKSDKED